MTYCDPLDKGYIAFGNYFKTREEAQKKADEIRKLLKNEK